MSMEGLPAQAERILDVLRHVCREVGGNIDVKHYRNEYVIECTFPRSLLFSGFVRTLPREGIREIRGWIKVPSKHIPGHWIEKAYLHIYTSKFMNDGELTKIVYVPTHKIINVPDPSTGFWSEKLELPITGIRAKVAYKALATGGLEPDIIIEFY